MKEIKIKNEVFKSFNARIVLPSWIYSNLEKLQLPSCKTNSEKISFVITYYLMNHK